MAQFEGFSKNQAYLVGVSGGADSMALLHLLWEAGFRQLTICHLHHGLRGADADEDLRFVENCAAQLRLPFLSERADVKSVMARDGISLEAAARLARHDFFFRCAVQRQCFRIFLAHHADDQAETALWTLLRGSHGVRGMAREQALSRDGRTLSLLRPLLGMRRQELREFLNCHGYAWREDASNAELFCARNRLRHEAIPLLAEIMQRDVTPALLRQCESSEELRACEAWMRTQAHALDPQGRIHVPTMRGLPMPVQMLVMRHFLESHGVSEISRALLCDAVALLDAGATHTLNLPRGKRLRRRQGRIFLEP